MGKLNREALAHYLDATFSLGTEDPEWEILGDDIEELSVELNPDTETIKNILGETKTNDNGYEPSVSADPYYADPTKAFYPMLRNIAMDRLKGDDCKTLMLEVLVEDTDNTTHLAYLQEVMVKPQSYGGGTEGVNIPFDVSECGARTKGTVTAASLTAGAPVFTAAS